MNEDTRMLMRWVCEGDLRRAQTQAQIILKKPQPKKDEGFAETMLARLEDGKAKFMLLPDNLKSLLIAEDASYFPAARFLLRPEEEAVVTQTLKIYHAAARLKEMRISYTPTLMLYGKSGTGKTMLAKYIAYMAGIPYLYVRFSGLVCSNLGGTQSNIAKVFDYAKRTPCVLCLDEIDAIAMERGQQDDVGEMSRIVISLMQELDSTTNDMIIVGTTNRFPCLDRALLRRFTKIHEVQLFHRDEAVQLVMKFLQFANVEAHEDWIEDWLDSNFGSMEGYCPDALVKQATQYIVNEIVG